MDKVLLIDMMNQIHRANVGLYKKEIPKPSPGVWVDNGQPFAYMDSAINPNAYREPPAEEKPDYIIPFNFFRNLRAAIEQFQPNKIFAVFEGHPTFRYDLFPEYKANRKIVKTAEKQAEADKFYRQKDIIIDLLKYFPITLVKASNYECDDTIATLAHGMSNEDVTILSNDTDFIQLLQMGFKSIKIYNPISKKFYEDPGYHYVTHKSLVGDPSDHIPGFDGIGKKTAEKMVRDPKKLEAFLNKSEENRANFNIYKSLIEFALVPLDELILQENKANWPELKKRFEKMEFNSITNDKSWDKYIHTFDCVNL